MVRRESSRSSLRCRHTCLSHWRSPAESESHMERAKMAAESRPSSLKTPETQTNQEDGIAKAFDTFWAKYREITLQNETQCALTAPTQSNSQIARIPSLKAARGKAEATPQAATIRTPYYTPRTAHGARRPSSKPATCGATQRNNAACRHRLPKYLPSDPGETPRKKWREKWRYYVGAMGGFLHSKTRGVV
ncbi:Hypothetical predicted protein [Pelobates cultripes]|uniref:Uncharacterized protein n=1 Tax=Pelobates cultripes TaxID=61616 RepID=A0AAD1RBV0_PELCU|nr:Hypothetical predicted protein [Pelobates cultripes]